MDKEQKAKKRKTETRVGTEWDVFTNILYSSLIRICRYASLR